MDVELVIKLPEEAYLTLKRMGKENIGYYHGLILEGTPLPKGHGDLVDRKKLLKKKQYIFKTQEMPFPRSDHFIKTEDLLAAQTIIEADKGEEK